MLDESEMERFVREGMEAWDLYDKRTKEKNNMYEEGFPVPDEHLNWKMRLQYGGATVTPELMEKVRAVDFLKDPPEVDLPPKSDKGRKEAEKIMQEEHDKRWKKVAEDVDDLLECFRGFDLSLIHISEPTRRYSNTVPRRPSFRQLQLFIHLFLREHALFLEILEGLLRTC